ncbi:MAG TPA: 50S ribosomal protein L25 [Acidimicrobiales bacterium]|jgi:large subunit ribosomal protein L25|nr:50S ribosomal protein L25 [Acidimicrobiales bacterium]
MAEITLVAETGRTTGTRASGRLRIAGRIPAVIYGHGTAPMTVSVDGRELRHALSTEAGLNQLLEVEVDGQRLLSLARELQRHPVRNTVTHVDFQIVRRDEIISAEVPIVLTGEAKAVETARGVVSQPLTSLTILATPGAIPGHIEVDISDLAIGDSIRVGDLSLPTGVTTEVDAEETVVIATTSAVDAEVAAEAAEAAAEGAAGDEGPDTEGGAGSDS